MSTKEFLAKYGREFGILLGLIGLCLTLSILTPYFLTVSNLVNIAQQISIIAIIAAGMTFVIITAGIDLSVGSVLAFSGIVLASALQVGASVPVAIMVGLVVGLLTGSVNGQRQAQPDETQQNSEFATMFGQKLLS